MEKNLGQQYIGIRNKQNANPQKPERIKSNTKIKEKLSTEKASKKSVKSDKIKDEKTETKEKHTGLAQNSTVFVVNLDKSTLEKEINDLFKHYGKIALIKMPKNDNNLCKGYAYVTYKDKVAILNKNFNIKFG